MDECRFGVVKRILANRLCFCLLIFVGCKSRHFSTDGAVRYQDTRVFPSDLKTCSPDVAVCSNSLPCVFTYAPGDEGWRQGKSGDYCLSKEIVCKNLCDTRPCYIQSESMSRPHKIVRCETDPIAEIKITKASSLDETAAAYKKYCQYNPEFETGIGAYVPRVIESLQKDPEYASNADYVNAVKSIPPVGFASISSYSGGAYREINKFLWTGERAAMPRAYQCTYVSSMMLSKALGWN
jgi:hypothetical protein